MRREGKLGKGDKEMGERMRRKKQKNKNKKRKKKKNNQIVTIIDIFMIVGI